MILTRSYGKLLKILRSVPIISRNCMHWYGVMSNQDKNDIPIMIQKESNYHADRLSIMKIYYNLIIRQIHPDIVCSVNVPRTEISVTHVYDINSRNLMLLNNFMDRIKFDDIANIESREGNIAWISKLINDGKHDCIFESIRLGFFTASNLKNSQSKNQISKKMIEITNYNDPLSVKYILRAFDKRENVAGLSIWKDESLISLLDVFQMLLEGDRFICDISNRSSLEAIISHKGQLKQRIFRTFEAIDSVIGGRFGPDQQDKTGAYQFIARCKQEFIDRNEQFISGLREQTPRKEGKLIKDESYSNIWNIPSSLVQSLPKLNEAIEYFQADTANDQTTQIPRILFCPHNLLLSKKITALENLYSSRHILYLEEWMDAVPLAVGNGYTTPKHLSQKTQQSSLSDFCIMIPWNFNDGEFVEFLDKHFDTVLSNRKEFLWSQLEKFQ